MTELTGSGKGGRSIGIAVIPISVTGLPSSPVILVPAGMWSSSPGMLGVVTTISRSVTSGMVTVWAVSSSGIQMV